MKSTLQSHLWSQTGAAMLIVLSVLLGLSLLALVAFDSSDIEMQATGNMTRKTRAFLAAEAGLARSDYVFGRSNNMVAKDSFLTLINSDTTLPNATFHVEMDAGYPTRRVVSTGTSDDGSAAVQVLYRHDNNPVNIWNNAIFAGHGQNGMSIQGNVGIHGSVHILGNGEPYTDSNGNGRWDPGEPYTDANHDGSYDAPLQPNEYALDMSGTSRIYNNYTGIPGMLSTRLPALPTIDYGGETVEYIAANLRVQNGNVVIDGNATVGQPNEMGGTPLQKETMDAVWVTDGFAGQKAENSVYSDNGWGQGYDLGETSIDMPNLDEPYTDKNGVTHPTYMNYLESNALVINGDLTIDANSTMPFVSNGRGSISLDDDGELEIEGIVYVKGNITILDSDTLANRPVEYDGRGTLVSTGDVEINTHFISKGTFPTEDAVGVIAHGSMGLGTGPGASQLKLMGAYFAQEEVINGKQNDIAGTIVANYFGMKNVPSIYQVPELVRHLPPGMPGADDIPVYSWRRVPRSWAELD